MPGRVKVHEWSTGRLHTLAFLSIAMILMGSPPKPSTR